MTSGSEWTNHESDLNHKSLFSHFWEVNHDLNHYKPINDSQNANHLQIMNHFLAISFRANHDSNQQKW